MNQYIIIALVWAGSLFSVGVWQHGAGVDSQKVADQVEFDRINAGIAEQKAQANAAYRLVQEHNILVMKERDTLKTKLQQEQLTNAKAINDLRTRYANVGLRYVTKDARLGDSGNSAMLGTGSAAGNVFAETRELPAAITASLRSIAYDCDALNVDYRLLYDWVHTGK